MGSYLLNSRLQVRVLPGAPKVQVRGPISAVLRMPETGRSFLGSLAAAGALLSSDDFGSSERRGFIRLWQEQGAVLHVLDSAETSEWWITEPGETTCRCRAWGGVTRPPEMCGASVRGRPSGEATGWGTSPGSPAGRGRPCRGRWGQPGPLDHHADPDGSDRDTGLLRGAPSRQALRAACGGRPRPADRPVRLSVVQPLHYGLAMASRLRRALHWLGLVQPTAAAPELLSLGHPSGPVTSVQPAAPWLQSPHRNATTPGTN